MLTILGTKQIESLPLIFLFSLGSDVYSSKRGRPQYSSLIPFPRVGRSSGGTGTRDLMYYGQKRGGKSGLIPFPRVGRGGANTWDLKEKNKKMTIGEYFIMLYE